ncbi:type II toxin-antitoxin system VapC family toxin [candidate division KSB1 bacterium]|nr:type II toxin-antitoxin system VapC family toxin [candidate division KSB1 bacterium]
MKGIDTNILVRFLTNDDRRQARLVYDMFKKAESNQDEFFVPLLVVLELIWVLESVYTIPRNEILDSLNDLLLLPVLKFESQSIVQQFTQNARETDNDLSDLLIAQTARSHGCQTVITFDKKAAESHMFELLE